MVRLAAAVFLVTAAVNLQLPLYGPMADAASLSSGQMSLLLQGYVAALLLVLVPFGGVADAVGRRSVVLVALACAWAATLGVLLAPNALTLGCARWLQGVGVGLVMGAAATWMAQFSSPATAARVAGLASTAGFGAGAVATSVFGLPATHAFFLVVGAGVIAACACLPDGPVEGGRWMRAPVFAPGTAAANLGICVGWSVAGIVVAVLPGVLHARGQGAWAGSVLAVLLSGGLLAQVDARRRQPLSSLRLGAWILPLGVAVAVLGVIADQLPLLFLGAAVTGTATHGWLYVGGLSRVAQQAPGQAGAVSAFFLCAYVGFGGPTVAMGAAVDAVGDLAWIGLVLVVAVASLGIRAWCPRSAQ